jgi:hypothetical protein
VTDSASISKPSGERNVYLANQALATVVFARYGRDNENRKGTRITPEHLSIDVHRRIGGHESGTQ